MALRRLKASTERLQSGIHQFVMAFQNDFVFVSGLDRSYGTYKRALVRRNRHNNQSDPGASTTEAGGHSSGRVVQMRRSAEAAPRTIEQMENGEVPEQLVQYNRRYISTSVDSPTSFDPFISLAASTPLGERLIRHCDSLFQDHHPHMVLVRQTGSDKACVYGMQAYAAYDLARLGQCSAEFALSARVASITCINDSLRDPDKRYSDPILGAILGAIAVDVQPASAAIRAQHRVEAGIHVDGLIQLLRQRGGLSALPHWLQVFYHWMDVQTAGMLSAAQYRLDLRQGTLLDLIERSNECFHALCLADITDFYNDAYESAKNRPKSLFPLGELFSVGTAFSRLLAADVHARPALRTATLLYVNAIVLRCNSDLEAVKHRLSQSRALRHILANGRGTTEALCFALLTKDRADGSHMVAEPEQASRLARQIYAFVRFAWHVRQQVEAMLYKLLISADLERDLVWKPAQFRALLSSDEVTFQTTSRTWRHGQCSGTRAGMGSATLRAS